jgi:hypothetical protein
MKERKERGEKHRSTLASFSPLEYSKDLALIRIDLIRTVTFSSVCSSVCSSAFECVQEFSSVYKYFRVFSSV